MIHFTSEIRWSDELHVIPPCNFSYVLVNDKWKRVFHFFPVNGYFSLGSMLGFLLRELTESQNQKFRRQKSIWEVHLRWE